jgi:hypothetical protein
MILDTQSHANLFQLSPPCVHEVRFKTQTIRKRPRRPPSLTLDQEEVVGAFIMTEASRGIYMIQKESTRFIEHNFNETLTYGWMDGFLERRASQFKHITIVSQELT